VMSLWSVQQVGFENPVFFPRVESTPRVWGLELKTDTLKKKKKTHGSEVNMLYTEPVEGK
uniref:Uncharacterized protein n=1 Tax=Urocitellus parryii TaxID=9999 RepID=A0A8D2I0E9_UROPR